MPNPWKRGTWLRPALLLPARLSTLIVPEYLLGLPKNGQIKGTVFLIHGWPDLSMGWRFQIPVLMDLGLKVVAPDMMGYGGTDAPIVPPNDLALYGMKRAADDIAELARQLGCSSIILGGHDWGGAVVYRTVNYYPQLVSHVFSVCTPYAPPSKLYMSLDDVVKRAPQFGYQKHLASQEVESTIKTKDQICQFLHGMYGARTADKKVLFRPEAGLALDILPKLGKTPLLTEAEMNYYVGEYSRHGLHGPLNWYRTREINWNDEKNLDNAHSLINVPVLFIAGKKDNVLLPSMSVGMEKHMPSLTRREVDAGHWALWEAREAVNQCLKEWFGSVVLKDNQSKI